MLGWVLGSAGLDRSPHCLEPGHDHVRHSHESRLGTGSNGSPPSLSTSRYRRSSSWKLGSLPVTTPPMALSWSLDIRTITLDSGLSQPKPSGIVWEHDAPEEAFMVKEIQEGALAQTRRGGEVSPRICYGVT